MLSLSRTNDAIRGSWLIDPTLTIPESFLAPLPRGKKRKNVSFNSRNGAISAEIRVAPSIGPRPLGNRTTMTFSSQNGSISVKIRKPDDEKVSITTSSWNGSTTIYIPHSFAGPIFTCTCNGSVTSSAALAAQTTVFTECERGRRSFVGDPAVSGWGCNPEAWTGDELIIETKNGSVKLMYVGDDEPYAGDLEKKPKTNISTSFKFDGKSEGARTGRGWWTPWGR